MSKAAIATALLALPALLLASSGLVGQHSAGVPQVDAAAREDVVEYIVRPGDSLPAIAARGFENPDGWREAATFNRLPETAALKPGSTLHLRSAWLKTQPLTAVIAAWRGDVVVRDASGERALAKGMALTEGDLIATAASSFVTLKLPDGSQVSLPSSSSIRITRLRHVLLTDSVDRRFRLERGASDTRVTPMANRSSRFLVSTPVAVAAVRGTEYRVAFDPQAQAQITGVTRGKVVVYRPRDTDDALSLPAGFGGSVSLSAVAGPVALLAAPQLAALPPAKQGALVRIGVKPQAGAVKFQVELATDAEFVDRMAVQEVDAQAGDGAEVVARFTGIEAGQLHVRVAAIDRLGLVGQPTVATFKRVIDPVLAADDARRQRREQLATLGDEDHPAAEQWYAAGSALDAQLYAAAGDAAAADGGGIAAGPMAAGDATAVSYGGAGVGGRWLPIGGSSSRPRSPAPLLGGGGGGGGGWSGHAGNKPPPDPGDPGKLPTDPSDPGKLPADPGGNGGIIIIPDDPKPPAPPPVENPKPGNGGNGQGGTPPPEVVPVPEVASWLLLVAGFGLVGAMVRRNRLVAAGRQ